LTVAELVSRLINLLRSMLAIFYIFSVKKTPTNIFGIDSPA